MTISIICRDKDPGPWLAALKDVDPSVDVQVWPHEKNKEDVEFALCWKQPKGVLNDYVNLRCICSMGAGVNHLLADDLFPRKLPTVRIIDPSLAESMYQYLLSVVMFYFKDIDYYGAQQSVQCWQRRPSQKPENVTLGIMGMGKLGEYAAVKFRQMGFSVLGWSRSIKAIPDIPTYAGDGQLSQFLSQTNILICLLPLTPDTRGILNAGTFDRLPKESCVINVARGEHVVEADLIDALDKQHLRGANLDVFSEEPLPQNHPFWMHEKILVTPHCSSVTDAVSVAPQIIENYRRMKEGRSFLNQVDLARGY